MAGAGEWQQRAVIGRVLDVLKQIGPGHTPPEIGGGVHRIERQDVGSEDPYRAIRWGRTLQVLALYPRLNRLQAGADDPLELGVRLSIAGNVMDGGSEQEYGLWDTVERVWAQPFLINDVGAFGEARVGTGQALYLADDAGETVFDRVLIGALGVPVGSIVLERGRGTGRAKAEWSADGIRLGARDESQQGLRDESTR